MKSKDNIRAGQLVIETRARFHCDRVGRKVPRAGIIEETSAKKARIFFYIGPDDPLELPLERLQSQWTEWDGATAT